MKPFNCMMKNAAGLSRFVFEILTEFAPGIEIGIVAPSLLLKFPRALCRALQPQSV